MKGDIFHALYFSLLIVALAGCAQTKQYAPQSIGTQYTLSGMPADLVRVKVNDFRAEKENSDQLIQTIKGQILSALSPEKLLAIVLFLICRSILLSIAHFSHSEIGMLRQNFA